MFTLLSEEQSRVYIDTSQLYEALLHAQRQAAHYQGTMRWKKSGGKDYLFKARDRKGNGNSLGVRSPETEAIQAQFMAGKEASQERLASLKKQLLLQAKYNKANRLGRLPTSAAKVLRALGSYGIDHTVIGTNAIYAYEALAGVQFARNLLATSDIDILLDARKALKIACKLDDRSLASLMKKVDHTFERAGNHNYRLVNNKGYYVDFLTQPTQSGLVASPFEAVIQGDIHPTDSVSKMDWILSSPSIKRTVVAADGLPVSMTTPDPRAFILHKYFVSKLDTREPEKRQRDAKQAIAVAQVLQQQLPQYGFDDAAIQAMPMVLRKVFLTQPPRDEEEPTFW